jgi:hypothetical protein
MGFPFKIESNLGTLFILLSITTMWGDIAVNNAKTTSSFKHDPSLISSNVKLAWFLGWKSLMVNPCPISSPHHVIPNTLHIQIVFKLVGSWVISPLKHLIKPMVSCINHWWVQQFTCILNHGFIILPFVVLTPSCDNKHANIPNLFHVCTPCLWSIGCVKHVVFSMLWHGCLKIKLFI